MVFREYLIIFRRCQGVKDKKGEGYHYFFPLFECFECFKIKYGKWGIDIYSLYLDVLKKLSDNRIREVNRHIN